MEIRKAIPADTGDIVRLIEDRIRWMDEQGLEQWNKFDYLEVFPPAYFRENIEDGVVAEKRRTGSLRRDDLSAIF